MYARIQCACAVCTDRVYPSAESGLAENDGKDHCQDQDQKQDVRYADSAYKTSSFIELAADYQLLSKSLETVCIIC